MSENHDYHIFDNEDSSEEDSNSIKHESVNEKEETETEEKEPSVKSLLEELQNAKDDFLAATENAGQKCNDDNTENISPQIETPVKTDKDENNETERLTENLCISAADQEKIVLDNFDPEVDTSKLEENENATLSPTSHEDSLSEPDQGSQVENTTHDIPQSVAELPVESADMTITAVAETQFNGATTKHNAPLVPPVKRQPRRHFHDLPQITPPKTTTGLYVSPGPQAIRNSTTPIVNQPRVVQFRSEPVVCICPFCQKHVQTHTELYPGAQLICMSILLFFLCGILCGFVWCCDANYDVIHECPNCEARLGKYERC